MKEKKSELQKAADACRVAAETLDKAKAAQVQANAAASRAQAQYDVCVRDMQAVLDRAY